MTLPDLVYPVHEADNEGLRYSLRTVDRFASHLFRTVWIVGALPTWARNVEHIPIKEPGEKFASIRAKLAAACEDDRVADQIVVMNDDYFATGQVESWEPTHMGSTVKYIEEHGRKKNTWWQALRLTAEWMDARGHGDILCYGGHVPLMYDREKLGALMAEYPADRRMVDFGLYPEAGVGGVGVLGQNTKVGKPGPDEFFEKVPDTDNPPLWLSSNDATFGEGLIGGYIRGMFRDPSQFEG